MFGIFNKWESAVKKLKNGGLSAQAFVNAQEEKVLYYSTPFLSDENGGFPNAVQKDGSDVMYFPAFTTKAGLSDYMKAIGCAEHILIKGDLKSVLSSLDSHPVLSEWGVVIDLPSALAVELPPQLRVQPKCLR